ncbi:MAG: SxtJ family membrane protein [Syntrophales bacterium]|nr:SxtJ family membrane protein [Syntrophales bacterium]MDD5640491.1 SxtJ family membrane protein [Syntrophales bacterium]
MEKGKTKGKGIRGWLLSSTREQARDTGMAMVLICLLIAYWGHHPRFLPLAIIVLLVTMIVPQAFRPLAVLWFGLSHVMGNVVSKVVLSIIFFVVVTPIGLIRRGLGKDSLQLRQWKKDQSSVFVSREGVISPEDLQNPY